MYALNFGLCQKFAITFGRPTGKREQRLYFVERIFDCTSILRQFMQREPGDTLLELRSDTRDRETRRAQSVRHALPTCKTGTCSVTNLSKKYESILNAVAPELLLPPTELGIFYTLESEKRPMYAGEIAAELDKSYQLVETQGKNASGTWPRQTRRERSKPQNFPDHAAS